jgi:hypothetical protein
MKKLNKLQINTDKLMKNEELMILRGGYSAWITCSGGIGPGCSAWAANCEQAMIHAQCNLFCPGWTSAVCSGA